MCLFSFWACLSTETKTTSGTRSEESLALFLCDFVWMQAGASAYEVSLSHLRTELAAPSSLFISRPVRAAISSPTLCTSVGFWATISLIVFVYYLWPGGTPITEEMSARAIRRSWYELFPPPLHCWCFLLTEVEYLVGAGLFGNPEVVITEEHGWRYNVIYLVTFFVLDYGLCLCLSEIPIQSW